MRMRSAMRGRLYWMTAGGLAFWLPFLLVSLALRDDENLWTLNVPPLAGLILLGVASWMRVGRLPKWGWVLAGIYTLGPWCMLVPGILRTGKLPPLFLFLSCLFPPITLWFAALNLVIFAVLLATVILLFAAVNIW